MAKHTVVCPHCTSTSTHDSPSSNGVQSRQCPSCHKSFHVEYHKGTVKKVTK